MFPFKYTKIGAYVFKTWTYYKAKHLGVDYLTPVGTPIYAPFDGQILKTLDGTDGGLTIWFKPNHDNVIMRFMHLSKFVASGNVKQGQLIAYSGNTGKSTAPHVHLDISKGQVDINDINNFIDPQKYVWTLIKTNMKSVAVLKFKGTNTQGIYYEYDNGLNAVIELYSTFQSFTKKVNELGNPQVIELEPLPSRAIIKNGDKMGYVEKANSLWDKMRGIEIWYVKYAPKMIIL